MAFLFLTCKNKVEKTKPILSPITESVYASGIIKSKNQYQAFLPVSGIIKNIFVEEGDKVKKGEPILNIANETQLLNLENAKLSKDYADFDKNKEKLSDIQNAIEVAKTKYINDSLLFTRQLSLFNENVGTKVELESRQLSFENSKAALKSIFIKYNDLKRQLTFASSQSKKNLSIYSKILEDFTLKSEIDGIVYSILKKKGEIISPQTPLAIIGDGNSFILEMQVDERDIINIKVNQITIISMDSYRGKVFEAKITKINPIMNERSKTFTVEAQFVINPDLVYPNTSFEANIILNTKKNALLIPRKFLINDSIVEKVNGDKVKVTTGLKDYNKIEILSGITPEDEIVIAN